jgi:hypothetical protein
MKVRLRANSPGSQRTLDGRLAAYLTAAGAVTAVMVTEAHAVVVGNNTVQPFGINGFVNIDFNHDGQTDFQIDHDRVTLPSGGPTLDYLQIDKNDINGESNPTAFDPALASFSATPFQDGVTARNDAVQAKYVRNGGQDSYPAALSAGTLIGPTSALDFQETNDYNFTGKWIRANRLIDEDQTQIDQVLGGQPASNLIVPTSGPNFLGLGGQVRYLGLQMDLNNFNSADAPALYSYGWIGIRITNEADATGEVVGYGYETIPGVPIAAGEVPEPTSIVTALIGGAAILGGFVMRRVRRG